MLLPILGVHHDTRSVVRAHRDVDIGNPLLPPQHQLLLILRSAVVLVRAGNLDVPALNNHRKGRWIILELDGARGDGFGGEGEEGEDVAEDRVEFVDEDDVVGFRKAEPA